MSKAIDHKDIKIGDRVRRTLIEEYVAEIDGRSYINDDYTYELIERPAPPVVLPTAPGFYLPPYAHAEVMELTESGQWFMGGEEITVEQVAHDCGNSLTLLRPVAEVAAEVLAEVQKAISLRTVPEQGSGRCLVSPLNLMSDVVLIRAKWATK